MSLSDGYPTLEEVASAFPHEIVDWYKSLGPVQSEEDREVMDAIFDRYHDILNNNNW